MPEVTPPVVAPKTRNNSNQGPTQYQKIVATMCKHPDKKWWLASDFMRGGEFFVGYEASARLSELQRFNPLLFETRANGRFKERRLVFERIGDIWRYIPSDIRVVIKAYYAPLRKLAIYAEERSQGKPYLIKNGIKIIL